MLVGMQVQVDAEKADRAARARSKNEQAAAEKKAAEAKASKPEKPAKDPA